MAERPPFLHPDYTSGLDLARYALSLEARVRELEEALRGCIPWVASNARGHAQENLAVACRLVGYDPHDWTLYPETLDRRIALLDDQEKVQDEDKE